MALGIPVLDALDPNAVRELAKDIALHALQMGDQLCECGEPRNHCNECGAGHLDRQHYAGHDHNMYYEVAQNIRARSGCADSDPGYTAEHLKSAAAVEADKAAGSFAESLESSVFELKVRLFKFLQVIRKVYQPLTVEERRERRDGMPYKMPLYGELRTLTMSEVSKQISQINPPLQSTYKIMFGDGCAAEWQHRNISDYMSCGQIHNGEPCQRPIPAQYYCETTGEIKQPTSCCIGCK